MRRGIKGIVDIFVGVAGVSFKLYSETSLVPFKSVIPIIVEFGALEGPRKRRLQS